MLTVFKLLISATIIYGCSQIGKHFPALAGLVAVMPLTSLLVLWWLASDRTQNPAQLAQYAQGAFWGIIPTMLFFLAAYQGFQRGWALFPVMAVSFTAWLVGALVHQWLLS